MFRHLTRTILRQTGQHSRRSLSNWVGRMRPGAEEPPVNYHKGANAILIGNILAATVLWISVVTSDSFFINLEPKRQ